MHELRPWQHPFHLQTLLTVSAYIVQCQGLLASDPLFPIRLTPKQSFPALTPLSYKYHAIRRGFSSGVGSSLFWEAFKDPRLADLEWELGKTFQNEYAVMRDKYRAPKNPIVLCHGLLGFDELRVVGRIIPAIAYWRGIGEALTKLGAEVITTTVPPSGSIEVRGKALMAQIEAKAPGRTVNLIGHSMGGIDCRYMISILRPESFKVISLTTIATPHKGSSFADYVFEFIGKERLPRLYHLMESVGFQTGAFAQLTTTYMQSTFNPACPDVESVKYYSYGAVAKPGLFSMFYRPHKIISRREGPNDGLVSVQSAKHGEYKGTLIGPTHLDIINWTNRLKWMITGRRFNAIAFYCDIAGERWGLDMLAAEGL
ncbi:Alpha/Beta hydrolase protein [Kalaharituber pfeilii]|nr:Alpha/Beta hydrolase protein [Kalaharituber pfeilii]